LFSNKFQLGVYKKKVKKKKKNKGWKNMQLCNFYSIHQNSLTFREKVGYKYENPN
jgi:hypothetical protein